MSLTREELLSVLLGYAVWLVILGYILIYRPVERIIESVKVRL